MKYRIYTIIFAILSCLLLYQNNKLENKLKNQRHCLNEYDRIFKDRLFSPINEDSITIIYNLHYEQ